MADCVVGPCRCGGFGILLNEEWQEKLGVCHEPIAVSEPTPAELERRARIERINDELGDREVCSWCYGEWVDGRREDAGRPLTEEELGGGFFIAHAECRPQLDALFASLASRGVFVDVTPHDAGPASGPGVA